MIAPFDSLSQRYASQRYPLFARNGMVSCSVPQASAAGLEVLRNGGNAMDAIIAAGIEKVYVRSVLTCKCRHGVLATHHRQAGHIAAGLFEGLLKMPVGLGDCGNDGSTCVVFSKNAHCCIHLGLTHRVGGKTFHGELRRCSHCTGYSRNQ